MYILLCDCVACARLTHSHRCGYDWPKGRLALLCERTESAWGVEPRTHMYACVRSAARQFRSGLSDSSTTHIYSAGRGFIIWSYSYDQTRCAREQTVVWPFGQCGRSSAWVFSRGVVVCSIFRASSLYMYISYMLYTWLFCWFFFFFVLFCFNCRPSSEQCRSQYTLSLISRRRWSLGILYACVLSLYYS